ncbi:uncharacterized protein KRP23_5663 [Phytophthora ramorum]|uniref:uncharacterized protein n=1 Tax=Phytophthora ramorum TaxID=164328 RepID=UPI0030AE4BC9|nr:hypothetical protein KRP23_5663 [Phytophthora ramorum]
MICAGGFTLRWATVVTAALLAMVMATGCNVMGSDSGSVSGSGDDADEAGVDGEDILFDTLDNGQHNCKKRMRGCPRTRGGAPPWAKYSLATRRSAATSPTARTDNTKL